MIGPAIIGSGQFLCWKPCCKEPVRLYDGEFERWMPVAIPCDRPRCQKRWTVQFPPTPPTEDAQAVWRLQLRPCGYARGGRGPEEATIPDCERRISG